MCGQPIKRVIPSQTFQHIGLFYIEPINVDSSTYRKVIISIV